MLGKRQSFRSGKQQRPHRPPPMEAGLHSRHLVRAMYTTMGVSYGQCPKRAQEILSLLSPTELEQHGCSHECWLVRVHAKVGECDRYL